MNTELPPLPFQEPQIRSRRRERSGPPKPPLIPADKRREITSRWLTQKTEIDDAVRRRSTEERRAIFYRLKHDRPLTQKDLAGTGLAFMSIPGADESLVFPRGNTLEKLGERLQKFAEGEEPDRPPGTELATSVEVIEIGDPKDRLSEEMLGSYNSDIRKSHIVYEIEVASFAVRASARKTEVQTILGDIRRSLGSGIHGAIFETDIMQDGARAVLRSTGAKLREFVEMAQWWRKIVFFDARPKFETFTRTLKDFNVGQVILSPPAANSEKICIIDTGVSAGNPFLSSVLLRELSHSFVNGFAPTEDANGHGSGVASLAAYHHLEISPAGENKAQAFIVSARITSDEGQLDIAPVEDEQEDRTRQARLLSNILRDVVAFYRPRDVRIFVLSFQIAGHIWSQATRRLVARNAWVGRTIDQLSRDHDVVFVTITGNILTGDIEDLKREQDYPGYLLHPLSKILDPGPTALGITVGSLANAATVIVAPQSPIALRDQPSPFTRSGPGFGNANKPDFVEYGGNPISDFSTGAVSTNAGTNVLMASGRLTPALQHSNGTSFAAPRVAHQFAVLNRDLRELGVNASAPLLKAFLATSAIRPNDAELLDAEGNLALLGLGVPDGLRASDCSDSSVILFWQGEITVDSSALFRVPVPVEMMESGRGLKRVVVALATAPPVQAWGVAEYLGAESKFRLFRGDREFEKIEALIQREAREENIAAKESVEDMSGVNGITRRSVGTLQCDTFEWSDHKEAYSTTEYTVAVSLKRAKWCSVETQIPTALVVRIEDTTGRCRQVYTRVRARVQARARA